MPCESGDVKLYTFKHNSGEEEDKGGGGSREL